MEWTFAQLKQSAGNTQERVWGERLMGKDSVSVQTFAANGCTITLSTGGVVLNVSF